MLGTIKILYVCGRLRYESFIAEELYKNLYVFSSKSSLDANIYQAAFSPFAPSGLKVYNIQTD